MAGHHSRNGSYRVFFYHEGKKRAFTLGRVTEAEAQAKADAVAYLAMRIKQGLVKVPDGVDVVEFVRLDGAVPETRPKASPTMGDLRDRYLAAHVGALEPETVRGYRRHLTLLVRLLGAKRPLSAVTRSDAQAYVEARLREPKRPRSAGKDSGPRVGPTTVRKEITTLRIAWNWAIREGIVSTPCPTGKLTYPKVDEPPPYMTMAEIGRIARGLPAEEADRLWDALYLTSDEVDRLLAHVRSAAAHPWIYPLIATAAHAGVRRSELLRMAVGDVDLAAGVVIVRERKRSHSRRTTRRIPMSSQLADALKAWLAEHPGGQRLFAPPAVVARSRKRSPKTGWKGKGRPTTEAARMDGVKDRASPGPQPLTPDEAHHHFKATLAGSEWSAVRGLHVLRHSFVSTLASKGVDQRVIDEFAGHSTEEQRRRYRHLHPGVQADAIKRAFG